MANDILTESGFLQAFGANVSHETMGKLTAFANLLTKWQRTINLVGNATIPDLWRRHFLDSAQLLNYFPPRAQNIIDFGSGAGFPVLVYALLLEDKVKHAKVKSGKPTLASAAATSLPEIHAIESDARKTAFMREAVRTLALSSVRIHTTRIEKMAGLRADIITARALAPLDKLLEYTRAFITPTTTCLFLKGQTAADEIAKVQRFWHLDIHSFPSISDPSGHIVQITNIREF